MRSGIRSAVLGLALAGSGCVPVPTGSGPARPAPLPPGQHALVFTREAAKSGAVNYLLFLPKGADEAMQRWPLIVYLHGRSLSGDDPQMLKKYGLPRLVEKDPAFPFIVLSPQVREGERWTDLDTVIALMDDVMAKFPVDAKRVYLTGYSMGGGGAWRLAGAHPDRFAAVITLAGTADPGAVKGLARLPVWAFHGSNDESTPLSNSEQMVEAIRAAGGDAKLTVLPDRDHSIPDVYERKDLYDWFLGHHIGEKAKDAPPAS